MEYHPRPRPCYGPNWYGGGNGAYAAGGYWDGGYPRGGGDGRFLPYGRGAVPAYGVGEGMGGVRWPPLGSAMPSTSHVHGWGWSADQYPHGAWAYPPMIHPSEAMRAAEAAAGEVLLRLYPTEAAERRRQEVIDYAKRLIGTTYGYEVYAFGSVPLKTYLPDGDIDITIVKNTHVDNAFIDDVYCLFSSEADNDDAQFVVKEVKFIDAKVKLIKCIIDNIVVDTSFNQIGGVSTFSFLELALYKFLEYYGKFDWDNYCVTLNGPMRLTSWRNSTIEPIAFNGELLFNKESFKGPMDRLIVLPIGSHRHDVKFFRKSLNIIDPLKGDNNLSNSIKPVSSHIMEAFKCGARKLGKNLKLPSELIADGIYGFFATTLGRHGRGERQDLGDSFLFQFMLDSRNGHAEDVSSLENPYDDKDENISPHSLLELADKKSNVKTNMHQSLGLTNLRRHSSYFSKNVNTYTESVSHHILTSSTRAKSLDVSGPYPIIESSWTSVHQEKLQLPTFSPSNLLDLSGDLGLHLKCLRNVQYNLEAWFDKFPYSVREASLAGVLDEDCFKSPTLRFLSDTNARSTDTDGMKISLVNFQYGARYVPQPSIIKFKNGALNQLSRTHIESSGLSLCPPVDANLEASHHPTYIAGMNMPELNFSLPPRTDMMSNRWSSYLGNYPLYLHHMIGDIHKRHGTGTYIPKMSDEICEDKKEKHKQPNHLDTRKKPYKVNSFNGHATIESATRELLTTKNAENREQRYENGSMETPPLPRPRIALPRHGGGDQGNLLVPSTGQPSPPAVTMVNGSSITLQQHENLEFGTMGPFSNTLLTAKFMEDFPSLASTMQPVQATRTKSCKPRASAAKSYDVEATCSTVQKPSACVSVTQSSPVEAPASPVQSPWPCASVSKCSPEGSYLLKDDTDFPPLQARTSHKR